MRWLKQKLLSCRSTWKVICSDMPIGLIVRDGEDRFENGANGNGPPLGRELELAELLRFIKHNRIRNVVWLTADVHYAASHYYDPSRAVFQDFDPFWEFVSGPLHAGTFGPNELDNTFGPVVKFCSVPKELKPNRPPSEGRQFFGQVKIDGQSQVMTVSHFNVAGERLWSTELLPTSSRFSPL
jgi:alkaline phosphatase D